MFFAASIAAKAFDYETNKLKENEQAENSFNLMDFLQIILRDPEFLQLDSTQQLNVLFAIYKLLENHFNKKV
jgi:hypothetical protein